MTNEEARKIITALMQRVDLKGAEVPAFGAAMAWLARAEVPAPAKLEEVPSGPDSAGE